MIRNGRPDLPMPRADWEKKAVYKKTEQFGRFQLHYISKIGIILIRALYDVHHIQPLPYGASNDYINLIHLPKDVHAQATGWFSDY